MRGCQLSEAPRRERSVVVGDARVGVLVVQRQRKRRASVVSQVVGDQVRKDRVSLHGIFGGVQVLEKRQAKTRTYLIADGQKQQPPQSLRSCRIVAGTGSRRRKSRSVSPRAFRCQKDRRVGLLGMP